MTQTEVSNSPEMPAPTMMTEGREGESINVFRETDKKIEREITVLVLVFVFCFGDTS